jgi:hypothetical protein
MTDKRLRTALDEFEISPDEFAWPAVAFIGF